MNSMDLYDSLDDCLQRLQGGETLEQALSHYPEQAGELRPLLQAAVQARGLRSPSVPPAVQNRSRAQFLAAAVNRSALAKPARRGFFSFWPSLSTRAAAALVVLVVLFTGLFGTGLVSAEALPGDTLYPVKLAVEQARLSLASDPASRLSLEESFDQRRVLEVARLVDERRSQQVTFAGLLSRPAVGLWQVSGVPVALPENSASPVASLVGTYVEVQGITGSGQVQLTDVRLRLFHLSGPVESMLPGLWVVRGVPVKIVAETSLPSAVALGDTVEISAIRVASDRLLALAVRVVDSSTTLAAP